MHCLELQRQKNQPGHELHQEELSVNKYLIIIIDIIIDATIFRHNNKPIDNKLSMYAHYRDL